MLPLQDYSTTHMGSCMQSNWPQSLGYCQFQGCHIQLYRSFTAQLYSAKKWTTPSLYPNYQTVQAQASCNFLGRREIF